jgi:predicted anti-sigma-YlaC factor YlaD
MTSNELTCKQLVELVTDYLELALSEEERARFEQHLQACGKCRAHISQVQVTVKALHILPKQAFPPADRSELLDLFQRWKGGSLTTE